MQDDSAEWQPHNPVEGLLADALACHPEPEWSAVTERLCAEHPALATQLRSLFERVRAVGLPPAAQVEPRVIGGYQLRRRLGAGGMGIVYEAEQANTGRLVALKLVRPELLESATARARFHREVELAASLTHPNICTVYEAGDVDGQPFLALQLVSGESLSKRIAAAPLPVATAIAIAEKLALALHAAHEAGLVHRDMKPANVILRPDGEPVLVDFGLARALDQEQSGLTLSGEVVGTPAYLAPEQIEPRRGAIDRRTDVYALGVTLHELLTGKLPFTAPTRDALYRRILAGDRSRDSWVQSDVSRDLRAIVETALDHEPRRRYATALELAQDLGRLRRHEPVRARRAGPALRLLRWSQRNRVAAVLLVVLSTSLIAVAWSLRQASHSLAESRQRQLVLASVEAERADPMLALHLARAAVAQSADFAAVTQLATAVRGCSEEFDLDLPFHGGATEIAFGAGGEFWCRGVDEGKNPASTLAHYVPSVGLQNVATPAAVVDLAVDAVRGRVVIVDRDGNVHELAADRQSWQPLGVEGAQCVAFARDGTLYAAGKDGELVTLGTDGVVANRKALVAGAGIVVLEPHTDRDLLLAGTEDGRVLCVERATGRVRELHLNTSDQQPKQRVAAIRSGAGSPWIAAHGELTQHVAVWNLDDASLPTQQFGGRGRGDPIACFQIVGNRLATGHRDQFVRLQALDSPQVQTFTGATGWVMRLALSPDRRLLVGCCGDGAALVWDLASGKLVRRVRGGGNSPSLVEVDPEGGRVLIAMSRGPLRAYTLQPERTPRLRGHAAGVRWCLPLPAASPFELVTAAADGSTVRWTGSKPMALGGAGSDLVTGACVLAADALIATLGQDAKLRFWHHDGRSDEPVEVPGATSLWCRMVALGSGRLLVVAEVSGNKETEHRWSCWQRMESGAWTGSELPKGLPDPATVWGLSSSADGRDLLVGHGNGTGTHFVRDGDGFHQERRIEHLPGVGRGGCYVEYVAIAPDGQRFLTGGTDRVARLWDRSGRLLKELKGHEEVLAAVAFSPAGDRIATLSAAKVWLWDRDGKALFRIQTDGGVFSHCAFLADGRRIAIASTDGSVWVEPVMIEDLLGLAAQRETRAITLEVLAPYAELLGLSESTTR
jgi:WD40 repeat protein